MGVHDGHRLRVKERYLEHGLDNFSDIEALEILLYYAIPRQDTNIIAHNLINHFGSLTNVFNATAQELMTISGIGENAAALITLVPQLMKHCNVKPAKKVRITSSLDAAMYFVPRFMMERDEVLLLVCLDPRKHVIACLEVSRGVVNSVQTNTRRIVELALKSRASAAIIAHNHPFGAALPSREDDAATKQIAAALKLVDVPLIDHIIVSGNDYVSYADSGALNML